MIITGQGKLTIRKVLEGDIPDLTKIEVESDDFTDFKDKEIVISMKLVTLTVRRCNHERINSRHGVQTFKKFHKKHAHSIQKKKL